MSAQGNGISKPGGCQVEIWAQLPPSEYIDSFRINYSSESLHKSQLDSVRK